MTLRPASASSSTATAAPARPLAAPVPRSLIVVGNLAVAVALSALQVAVLSASGAGGADFTPSPVSAGSSPPRLASPWPCTASPRRSPAASRPRRVHRRPAAGGHRALVPRRVAVSDQRPARRAHRRRQGAALHPCPRPPALRPRRSQRAGPARHLGHEQHHRRGAAEPRCRRGGGARSSRLGGRHVARSALR